MAHPVAAGGVVAVAAMAVYMQAGRAPYDVAPSPADLIGALRIGLLQHGTLLGAALAGLFAGMSIGDDLTTGTVETWRLSDPRWRRRWLRRVGVLVGALVASSVFTALVLRATGSGAAGGPSSLRDLAVDGIPALVAIVFFASACSATALVVRNPMVLVLLTVAVVTVPSFLSGPWLQWFMPSGWIGDGLYLSHNGHSINFLSEKNTHDTRYPSQAIALGSMAATALVTLAVGAIGAERKGQSNGV
jgi:hypothetical protein